MQHHDQTRRLYTATALIYAAVFAYTLLRWDSIPDPVAVHIGVGGEVDGIAPKTFLSTTAVVLIGAAISLGTALIMPAANLARATNPETTNPETKTTNPQLPFSETAAQRAELLIDKTQLFVAQLLLGTALLLSLVHLRLVFPDVPVPFPVFIAAMLAYIAWAIWSSIRLHRQAKQDHERIQKDAEEQQRITALSMKAGAGIYSEPNDPMAVTVLPSEPGRLQFNSAHPAGKRQLIRSGIGIVGAIAIPIIIGFSI